MKRLGLLLCLALLTFGIGVTSVWGYSQFRRLSATISSSSFLPKLLITRPGNGVKINFIGITKTEYGSYAEFRVVNWSLESLHYSGYSREDHCSYKISRGDRVEQRSPCWCGTGLEKYKLSPGRSATYKLSLTPVTGKVRVGFDFGVGKARRQQTFWSDEIVFPAP